MAFHTRENVFELVKVPCSGHVDFPQICGKASDWTVLYLKKYMTDEGTVFHLLIDHSHTFKITQEIIFQVTQTSSFVCPDVCPKGIWILEEISRGKSLNLTFLCCYFKRMLIMN
jgi:hypothetical protein